MEMDKSVMIQVKCKGMKKSEMHIVSYSDGTEVNKDVDWDDNYDDDDNVN